MAGTQLDWLAHAFERHLATLAARGHRKAGECFPFNGANESTVMLIADRILTGLGFHTWPESRMYDENNKQADLWAESPSGGEAYMVEGKVVWDGEDNRLNRKRFTEKRELAGDFDRLGKATCSAHKVVVWVAFSPTAEVVSAGEDARTMRLGDALAAVEREFPAAALEARTCVGFENHCDCPTWKFAHVLCWVVK